jgi:hypothetical protein
MEVGLSILLRPVVNFVVDDLEFDFFCLSLPLNFKSYFFMSSKIIAKDKLESCCAESDLIISVLISNYPLSNGGYLVSFGTAELDGSLKNYDPFLSSAFEGSSLSKYLNFNPIFLPAGCFYLPDSGLESFVEFLISGASFCQMKLLPASSHSQGLILFQVNESKLFRYEQKEENKR